MGFLGEWGKPQEQNYSPESDLRTIYDMIFNNLCIKVNGMSKNKVALNVQISPSLQIIHHTALIIRPPRKTQFLHINHFQLNELLINSVYFCSVTDDDNSHVHGVLTADNLFDGTISTSTEHFYIEPAHKYSKELPKTGVHSIIYKLSDVKMNTRDHNDIDSNHEPHCASEKLFRKLQKDKNYLLKKSSRENSVTNEKHVNEKSDTNLNKFKLNDGVISRKPSDNHKDKLDVVKRFKRWLPDEEVRKSIIKSF